MNIISNFVLFFYVLHVYVIVYETCLYSYSVSSLLRDIRPNTLLDNCRLWVHKHCCFGKIWSTLRHNFLRNTQTNTLIKRKKSKLKLFALWNQQNLVFSLSTYFIYSSSVLSHNLIVLLICFWISVFMYRVN